MAGGLTGWLIGVFGAFMGGDFLVSQMNGGVVDDKVFHVKSLFLAVGGAVGMLMALRLLRHVVGPIGTSKSRTGDR